MKILTALLVFLAMTLTAQAKVVTKSVAYAQGGVKLNGFISYDDSFKGKRGGVLVVPEWWGITDYIKGRAEQIAQLGYVAFTVDMYGGGMHTNEVAKAKELSGQFYGKPLMAERAQAALDELKKNEMVDPSRIAAIGFCFGGSTVQALAYSGAPLLGIVSFHGGPIPASAEAAARTKAKFLILHGALDPFTKPEDFAAFQKSLEDGKIDYQVVIYAHAVHAFTNPDADRVSKEAGLQGIGYNEAAAKRSWKQMRVFFDEIFATK